MASYVEKTLGDGEDIVFSAHFNWTYSFWSFFYFMLSIVPSIALIIFHLKGGLNFDDLRIAWGFSGFALVVGIIQYLWHMIILWTTEIAVTTFRFVYKKGLISRITKEVSLNKIEEITLNQSIWGRIFNFGALTLRGTGVGVIELPNIDDPIKVRKVIENAKSGMRTAPIGNTEEAFTPNHQNPPAPQLSQEPPHLKPAKLKASKSKNPLKAKR